MRPSLFLIATLAATAVACSSDTPTAPVSPVSVDSATSATGVTIAVDTATNLQRVVVGTTISLHVHLFLHLVPVPSTSVAWAVTAGNGTLSAATSVTDSTGLAIINYRVGDSVATNTVTASIAGASVILTATTFAAPASELVKTSPDSQAVVAGGAVPLIARVIDRFGNPIDSATVLWTFTGGSGGSVSVASALTSASGNATTNFTTGALPGVYEVTATVPGQASVTFKVVGF